MSVNLLETGPARNPYFTSQEVVYYNNSTATFSTPSTIYTELTLPVVPVGGSLNLFTPSASSGSTITLNAIQGGLYAFQVNAEWNRLTATTAYNENLSIYLVYNPATDFDYNVSTVANVDSTVQFQSATFLHRLYAGDQFYFAVENDTPASAYINIINIKIYLISAM